MNKASIIILFKLLLLSKAFGQLDINRNIKIKQYSYQIDTTSGKFKSLNLKIDTVQIEAKKYFQKTTAKCLFEKSKSLLTINYYFKNDSLLLISVEEQSPKYNNMYYESLFFYKNEKLFDEEYSSTVRAGLVEPKNKTIFELYGYNQNLTEDFLKSFVIELYKKLK